MLPAGLRKFIGTFLLLVLIVFYAVFAVAVASVYLGEANILLQFAYFLFSGLLWVVPAMWLVKWMATAPRA